MCGAPVAPCMDNLTMEDRIQVWSYKSLIDPHGSLLAQLFGSSYRPPVYICPDCKPETQLTHQRTNVFKCKKCDAQFSINFRHEESTEADETETDSETRAPGG